MLALLRDLFYALKRLYSNQQGECKGEDDAVSHPMTDTVFSFAAQDAGSRAVGERANSGSLIVGMRIGFGCFTWSVVPQLGINIQWQCMLRDFVIVGV